MKEGDYLSRNIAPNIETPSPTSSHSPHPVKLPRKSLNLLPSPASWQRQRADRCLPMPQDLSTGRGGGQQHLASRAALIYRKAAAVPPRRGGETRLVLPTVRDYREERERETWRGRGPGPSVLKTVAPGRDTPPPDPGRRVAGYRVRPGARAARRRNSVCSVCAWAQDL